MEYRFWKREKKQEEEIEVPEEWAEEIQEQREKTVKLKRVGPRKIKLPGGRVLKRGMAWVIILLNILGFISSATMGTNSLPLLIYFILNMWMLREYLYETRDKELLYDQVKHVEEK